jgi:hypothetical protein
VGELTMTQNEPLCLGIEHRWEETYYGYKCIECGEFIPFGSEPWIDTRTDGITHTGAHPMHLKNFRPAVDDDAIMWRSDKMSKAAWISLYFDLYRQCFGETETTEQQVVEDAENRLQILKANGIFGQRKS